MTLAIPDLYDALLEGEPGAAVDVLAPGHYQERAVAAYEDAELLLTAILPDARVAHVGASAVPGAYSRGEVDICVAVPRDSFGEALGVLVEAGFTIRPKNVRTEQLCVLDAPYSEVPLALLLIETGSRFESLRAFRDALRSDASLLARYNAVRIEAGPQGAAAYRGAKNAFIERVLRASA
jgi:GrpB-like predicted nucleotidyltransferase (UPF0157 family)